MKTDLYDNKGKKTSKQITLDDSVFAGKINQDLLRQYVYVYLGNQRQSNAHTKERGDVRGGGKKPWKQKGTGRARHGSSRSPIWKGGSVTFGPSNDRNFKKILPKKMKQAAMRAAFAQRAAEKGIVVLQDPELGKKATTKQMVSVMNNLKLGEKVMLLQATADKGMLQATRNIPDLKVSHAGAVNAYEVLNNKTLVILESALPVLTKTWGKPEASKAKPETKKTKTKGGKQ